MYINPYIVSGKPESDMKNRDKKDKLKHKSLGEKKITIKDNYKIL